VDGFGGLGADPAAHTIAHGTSATAPTPLASSAADRAAAPAGSNRNHMLSVATLAAGLGIEADSELIGLRDEVGGLDGGSALAYLIEELHGSCASVAGGSSQQDLGVGQTEEGEQAMTPELGQHPVALFEQRHGFVEVTGGRCTDREIDGDRSEDRAVGMRQ
jgi:hypothetical protein